MHWAGSLQAELLGGHEETSAFDPRALLERYRADDPWGDAVRDALQDAENLWRRTAPGTMLMVPEILASAVLLVTDGLPMPRGAEPAPRVSVPLAPGSEGDESATGRFRLACARALRRLSPNGISWIPLRLFGAGTFRKGEARLVRRFIELARPAAVVAVGGAARPRLWHRVWPLARKPDLVVDPPPTDPSAALRRLRVVPALDSVRPFP